MHPLFGGFRLRPRLFQLAGRLFRWFRDFLHVVLAVYARVPRHAGTAALEVRPRVAVVHSRRPAFLLKPLRGLLVVVVRVAHGANQVVHRRVGRARPFVRGGEPAVVPDSSALVGSHGGGVVQLPRLRPGDEFRTVPRLCGQELLHLMLHLVLVLAFAFRRVYGSGDVRLSLRVRTDAELLEGIDPVLLHAFGDGGRVVWDAYGHLGEFNERLLGVHDDGVGDFPDLLHESVPEWLGGILVGKSFQLFRHACGPRAQKLAPE